MKTYLLVQPSQNPPGNPGGVDPRANPVPIAGTGILLIAAILLGLYFLWKRKQLHK
jgi:hypothetical protein